LLSLGKDALNEQMNMSVHDECMSLLADQHHDGTTDGAAAQAEPDTARVPGHAQAELERPAAAQQAHLP